VTPTPGGPEDFGGDPHESPHEPDLPGEDNPGERLIEKYDPTIEGDAEPGEQHIPDPSEVDIPADTARLFWYLVVVFNVSLVALSIGVMMMLFLDETLLGGQITLVGAILFGYGYYRYRSYQRETAGDDAASE